MKSPTQIVRFVHASPFLSPPGADRHVIRRWLASDDSRSGRFLKLPLTPQ
jgi:hypothetical protein